MIRAMNTSCLRFLSGLLTLSLLLSVLTHAPLHSHEQANAVEAPQAHHCHDHQDHAHSESSDSESNEECLTCLFLQGLTTPTLYAVTTGKLLPVANQAWRLLYVSPTSQDVVHPAEARAPPA